MNIQLKDCAGKAINVGARIAYPVRRGSNMEMRVGQVTSIGPRVQGQGAVGIVAKVRSASGRTINFQSFGRCAVID